MKLKKEKFIVAGVSHYADDIMEKFSYENDDYSLSAKELSEIYDIGDRVFEYSFDDCNASLVPEPTNEHDPNAVRVEIGGVLIGYVKRGSCSHVKNLLNSPDFDHIKVEIGGGKYKRLYEDDDKIKVEKDSCGLFADLYIYTRHPEQESATTPITPVVVPSPVVPSPADAPRKMDIALSIFMIVSGSLIILGGLVLFLVDIFTGGFFLFLGFVFLSLGIQKRRKLKMN